MSSSVWGKIEKPEADLQKIMCEQITALIMEKTENRVVKDPENSREYLRGHKEEEYSNDNYNKQIPLINEKRIALNFEPSNMSQTKFEQENEDCEWNIGSNETNYIDFSSGYEDESPQDSENIQWDWFEFVEDNFGLMPSILKYNVNVFSKDSEEVNAKNKIALPSHTKKSSKSEYHSPYYRATTDFGFDKITTQLFNKMIQRDILEGLYYCLHFGKRSKFLVAYLSPKCKYIEGAKKCAVKVYSNSSSELEQSDNLQQHQIRRNILHAEREMVILCRLKRACIPCPEVLMLKDNVLVTSFLGGYDLSRVHIDTSKYIIAYNQVVTAMKNLYQKAQLVHGRLRADNFLWGNDQCYFVGCRRAVDVSHKKASDLLYRDCKNIIKFFKSKLDNVTTPDKLYESIVGHETSKHSSKKSTEKQSDKVMDRFQTKSIKKFEHLSKLLLET